MGQFRDSISGVPTKCAIWMQPQRRAAENTIGSKVVAYSRVQAVMNLVCPSARDNSPTPKGVSNAKLTSRGWFLDADSHDLN
jgi:hypothetical protein